MAYYTLLFSPTGGTRAVAAQLSKGWYATAQIIDLTDSNRDFSKLQFSEDDVCLVAVPSYGGRVPAIAAQRLAAVHGGQARAVLLSVYGNRAQDDTLRELYDVTKAAGFCPVAAVAAIAEHSIVRKYGAGRPDAADLEQLKTFAAQIAAKLTEGSRPETLQLPGNDPYCKYQGVPFHPAADKNCIKCGRCSEVCPVGAIPAQNPSKTDTKKCITCMRCVKTCPTHARKINPVLMFVAEQGLKKGCATRKENELFL